MKNRRKHILTKTITTTTTTVATQNHELMYIMTIKKNGSIHERGACQMVKTKKSKKYI